MRGTYSENQKMRIMLLTDFLGEPLSSQESAEFDIALKQTEGDVASALAILSPSVKSRLQTLLGQGLKFSLELDKLTQRGISIRFVDDGLPMCLEGVFVEKPAVLFMAGNQSLLEEKTNVSFSLGAFKNAGYVGVFVADRPLGNLLKDEQVSTRLRSSSALIVSDLLRHRASIKPADDARPLRQKADEARKKVFISGSRSQIDIPPIVQGSLEAIIKQGIKVLIGDSDKGVDNEVVDFFRAPLYRHVTLYTISNTPRVSPEPEWAVITVEADSSLKAQQRQMVKDRAMADEADWGMALFNPVEKNRRGALQVSAGTLRNAIQMLLQGKMVKFFYVYEGKVASKNLKRIEDLEAVIESYRHEALDENSRRIILSAKGVSPNDDPSNVKAEKIFAKYKALRKTEEKLLKKEDDEHVSEPDQATLPLFDSSGELF